MAPKTGKNRLHLDVAPPADGDQQAEVERLISLGAKRIDIGQGDVSWEVMADPDGNEFCVADAPLVRHESRGRLVVSRDDDELTRRGPQVDDSASTASSDRHRSL